MNVTGPSAAPKNDATPQMPSTSGSRSSFVMCSSSIESAHAWMCTSPTSAAWRNSSLQCVPLCEASAAAPSGPASGATPWSLVIRSARKASRAQYCRNTCTGRPITAAPTVSVAAACSLSSVPENRTTENVSLSVIVSSDHGFLVPRSIEWNRHPRGGRRTLHIGGFFRECLGAEGCLSSASVREMSDLVLLGTIMDGTGSPPFAGWVAVEADRIVRVGRLEEPAPQASRTIGGDNVVVAPGFVDVHNHSDLSPFLLPEMPSTVRMGVTTVVVGNCGSSPWPLAAWDEAVSLAYGSPGDLDEPTWSGWRDYLSAIDRAHPAVNIATLVGHGSVRREVLGAERRAPSATELNRMCGLVREAIADGAIGMSTGLIYVPGIF